MSFKVGDKVRAYVPWGYYDAVVLEVDKKGFLLTLGNERNNKFSAHPKQCRKLVKRKKHE